MKSFPYTMGATHGGQRQNIAVRFARTTRFGVVIWISCDALRLYVTDDAAKTESDWTSAQIISATQNRQEQTADAVAEEAGGRNERSEQ